MKLAFLGPAAPFRGGIVTYFGMLARILADRGHEVFWASFRKQYPRFLFPGSEQEGATAPWLDHANSPRFVPWSPVSWWQTSSDLKRQGPRAVVIKFWIPFFAPGFFGVTWLLRRRTEIRIIYLLDNVTPHEKYPFGRFLTRLALKQGHGFIAQSDQVRQDLFSLLPDIDPAKVITTPHPVYDFGKPGRPRKTAAEARDALGLPAEARLVLFPEAEGARLAWQVEVAEPTRYTSYLVLTDALDGTLLYRQNLTLYADATRIDGGAPGKRGKLPVWPVMYAAPASSTAIPVPWSIEPPPKRTE